MISRVLIPAERFIFISDFHERTLATTSADASPTETASSSIVPGTGQEERCIDLVCSNFSNRF